MLPPGAFKTHERLILALQLGVTASALLGSIFMRDSSNEFFIALYILSPLTFATVVLALARRHLPIRLAAGYVISVAAIAFNTIKQPILPLVFSLNRDAFSAASDQIKAGAHWETMKWIGTVPILNASECRPGIACFRISNGGAGATIIASTPCTDAPFNDWQKVDLAQGWCWIKED